ncbi:MAG: hypothetical protein ACKOK8_04905, partial [Planctomycetia bacterium]
SRECFRSQGRRQPCRVAPGRLRVPAGRGRHAAAARALGIEVSFCGTRGHGVSPTLRWDA